MAKNVHALISDLKSGLTDLENYFRHLGSVFSGSKKTSSRGRKARKTHFTTNTSRFDPYKNFKFRARKRRKSKATSAPDRKARKKMKMSPALRAQRKLQGRYMGMIRRLPKAKQAQVKKIRKEKGYEAALQMMG